jgi:hypothetical protein
MGQVRGQGAYVGEPRSPIRTGKIELFHRTLRVEFLAARDRIGPATSATPAPAAPPAHEPPGVTSSVNPWTPSSFIEKEPLQNPARLTTVATPPPGLLERDTPIHARGLPR